MAAVPRGLMDAMPGCGAVEGVRSWWLSQLSGFGQRVNAILEGSSCPCGAVLWDEPFLLMLTELPSLTVMGFL